MIKWICSVLAVTTLLGGMASAEAKNDELSGTQKGTESQTHSNEELQMIAETMSSLTGGLERMAAPPKLDSEIILPLDGKQPEKAEQNS